ncbi:MAG: hypothetical protein AMXMBFR8_06640 [Nevskiales bacterium]
MGPGRRVEPGDGRQMIEFLTMGGYAAWVWSAFGLTVVVLWANIAAAGRRYRQAKEKLRLRAARDTRSVLR